MLAAHGPEQILLWRCSYTVRPPELADLSAFRTDPRYVDVSDEDLPGGESLQDVEARLMPYWNEVIVPQLASGLTVMLGAHGNSLRALVKNLERIGDDEVAALEIATGVPRFYEVRFAGEQMSVSAPTLLGTPTAH